MDTPDIVGWVWSRNLYKLFEWLSIYISYDFAETDWQAIADALPSTDDENLDGWSDYPLVGAPRLLVTFARSVGADPVMVKVSGDMDAVLRARVDTIVSLLADL